MTDEGIPGFSFLFEGGLAFMSEVAVPWASEVRDEFVASGWSERSARGPVGEPEVVSTRGMLNVVLTPADLVGLVFFVQHAAEAWAADAALDLLWHRVRGALARLLHLNKSGRGGSVHFRSEIRYDGESVTSIVDAKLSGQENPVAVAAIIE